MKMSFTQEKETNLHTGPNGEICDSCQIYEGCTPHQMDRMLKQINELAHEIVKYCDHYKAR